MKPGEIITGNGNIDLNKDSKKVTLKVSNTGDRPIQVGSHFHFYETNEALIFKIGEFRSLKKLLNYN